MSRWRPRFLPLRRALRRARAAQRGTFPARLNPTIALLTRTLATSPRRDDRLVLLAGLAALHEQATVRGEDGVRTAVELLIEAATLARPDLPHAGPMLLNVAVAHSNLFAVTGDPAVLEDMVRYARMARAETAAEHPNRADVLDTVVALLVEAEDFLALPDLLDEAIDAGRESVAAGGTGLHNLATAYRVRFERTGNLADLAEARRLAQDASWRRDVDGETMAGQVAELGHILALSYQALGDAEFAHQAVVAWRRSVEFAPEAGNGAARRAALAGALVDSHQAGDPAALDEALTHACAALAHPKADGDFGTCHTVATVLSAWADQHRDGAVLREAESAARAAVLAAGARDGDRATALDTLADLLRDRFRLEGDTGLLDEAIATGESAVAIDSGYPTDQARHAGHLGVAKLDRYAITGDRDDLDDAVDLARRAVDELGDGHPDLPIYLNNLGIALRHRYQATGNLADLAEAVERGRAAVAASAPGPDLPFWLGSLGSSLYVRHERLGDLADLDEDVDLHREAVRLLPAGHPALPGMLSNLGVALRFRQQRLGTQEDLVEAVAAHRDAVAARPRPVDLPMLTGEYGSALAMLFESTGDLEQFDLAVEHLRRAVEISHDDDPALADRIGNLVSILSEGGVERPDAVSEAVAAGRRALDAVSDDDPHHLGIRINLARALRTRREEGDLDEAERLASATVEEIPADHPDRARFLVNLAAIRRARFGESHDPRDRTGTLDALRQAAQCADAPPISRIEAARFWGQLAAEQGDAADAAEGFALAVELLPEVSPQRLERADAQRWLADYSGLACAAAAWCLACDQPERAVGLLELGRGVLLNRLLRIRDDTAALRAADADLAAEFERLRDQLDELTMPGPAVPARPASGVVAEHAHARTVANRQRERRRDLVGEFTDVVRRVQAIPALTGFLRPPAVDELLRQAEDGPVVIVNVSEYRCDALLLTRAGLRQVPLPELRMDEVDRVAVEFHRDVARAQDFSRNEGDRSRAEDRLSRVLGWLWDTVAAPVLFEVERLGTPQVLRWVPTGSLVLLPMHAATASDGGGSVLDWVASSYTPTVSALHHARRNDAGSVAAQGAVLISTYQGEEFEFLPSAQREARRVATRLGVEPLDAARLSRDTVLAAIRGCSHLHVALHARSDADDPSRSSLRLGVLRLSVLDIVAVRNERAELAYLSACETTLTSAALVDESIHLTSAFQLAGFRGVVGTLWRIPDLVATRAARVFYDQLSESVGDSVTAAHAAARYLRDRYHEHPSVWAAYHHAGD